MFVLELQGWYLIDEDSISISEIGEFLTVVAPIWLLYAFTFYRFGHRIYRFFSLFVNFTYSFRSFCKRCQVPIRSVELPKTGESKER